MVSVDIKHHVYFLSKLQALVYDILLPTIAVIGYAIGLPPLGAQVAASL